MQILDLKSAKINTSKLSVTRENGFGGGWSYKLIRDFLTTKLAPMWSNELSMFLFTNVDSNVIYCCVLLWKFNVAVVEILRPDKGSVWRLFSVQFPIKSIFMRRNNLDNFCNVIQWILARGLDTLGEKGHRFYVSIYLHKYIFFEILWCIFYTLFTHEFISFSLHKKVKSRREKIIDAFPLNSPGRYKFSKLSLLL